MNLGVYAEQARRTRMTEAFSAGLNYSLLGLAGEAGECANIQKKVLRGSVNQTDARDLLIDELGDVLWYVSASCDDLAIPLEFVAEQNLAKLQARYDVKDLDEILRDGAN